MTRIPLDRLNVPAFLVDEEGNTVYANPFLKRKIVRAVDDGDSVLCFLSHQRTPVLFSKLGDCRVAFRYMQKGGDACSASLIELLSRILVLSSPSLSLVTERKTLHPLLRKSVFFGVPFGKDSILPEGFLPYVLKNQIDNMLSPHGITAVTDFSEELSAVPCRYSDLDMLFYLFTAMLLHLAERKAEKPEISVWTAERKFCFCFSCDIPPEEKEASVLFLRCFGSMLDPFCGGFETHYENGRFVSSAVGICFKALSPVLASPTHRLLSEILTMNCEIVSDVLSSVSFHTL